MAASNNQKKNNKKKNKGGLKKAASVPGKKAAKKDPIDLWLEYLMYALIVLVPLTFSRVTFDQFDIVKMAIFRYLTIILLFVWLLKVFTAKTVKINRTRLEYLLLSFLVIASISVFTSIHFFSSLQGKFKRYEGIFTFINYAVIYFLALQVFDDRQKLARLARFIGVTAIVVAFYGSLQYLGLDPLDWGTKPFEERSSFSSFGNPDLLAAYLALSLPILLGNYLSARNNLEAAMFGFGFFIVGGSLLTTSTRGGWIGALIGVVVFFILTARMLKPQLGKIAIIAAVSITLFAGLLIYSSNPDNKVMNLNRRITSAFNFSGGSVGSRVEIWNAGLAMVADRPLLGQGLGTFRMASEHYETFNYVKMVGGRTVADNAHNYVIQLLAGAGIPATLFFVSFIFLIFYYAFRAARNNPDDELSHDLTNDFTIFSIAIGLIGFVVYLGFVVKILNSNVVNDNFLANLFFSFFLWLAFSVMIVVQQPIKRSSIKSRVDYSYPALVAAAIGYFAYLISGISVVGSSAVFWVILGALIGGTKLKKTWSRSQESAFSFTVPMAMILIIVMFVATFTTTRMLIGDFNFANAYFLTNTRSVDAAAAYERAFSMYPNARYQTDLGRYYIGQGNLDLAISAFEKAKDAEPVEADVRIFLGNIYYEKYLKSGDAKYKDMAIEEMTFVIDRRPFSVPANYLMGGYYLDKKEYKKAVERYHVVEQISPTYGNVLSKLAETYKELGDAQQANFYVDKAKGSTGK